MKLLKGFVSIILVTSFFICSQTFAQLKDSIHVERKIPLKNDLSVDNNIVPVISLVQPNIKANDTLAVDTDSLHIAGSVSGGGNDINLYMNNSVIFLNKDNKFNIKVKLLNGLNPIQFTAVCNNKYSSKFRFIVINSYKISTNYKPAAIHNEQLKTKPIITILQPEINEGLELTTNHKKIAISIRVETENEISKVLVNDVNALMLNKNDFYIYYSLVYGTNNILIKAFNKSGNYSEKNIIINCTDSSKAIIQSLPIITLQPNLRNGDTLTVNSNNIKIIGSVSGGTDNMNLYLNNAFLPFINGNNFSEKVDLEEGSNLIQFTAVDGYNNTSILKYFTVIRTPFKAKPIITILQPEINEGLELTTNHKKITISGRVETNYEISKVVVNEENATMLNKSDFYLYYNLVYGTNNILIKAFDKSGVYSEKNIIINCTDSSKGIIKSLPIITLQPNLRNGDTLTVNSNTITINGNVSGENDHINLYMNNNIVPFTNGNNFSEKIDLVEGLNPIQFKAVDENKNTSILKIIVCYTIIKQNQITTILNPVREDKPILTLLEPVIKDGNELTVEDKMITISGRVKTNDTIGEVLINNKKAVMIDNENFYYNYELTYGTNKITVKAVDKTGNSSDTTVIVFWAQDLTGPVIKIIDPPVSRGIKVVCKSEVVLLKGEAIDKNGIFEVTVNNRKANLKPNGDFNINLYLQPDDNQLIVKAVDNNHNITIDTFVVVRKLEALITSGKYIALIIGINSYKGYWPPLINAVNDAVGLEKVLKNDYLFDTVITIIDKQATREKIIHQLEYLSDYVKDNDNLLIFYSGHGQFKKGFNKGYWVPVDAQSNSVADFISNSEIKTFMEGIPAKHTLLISDACFAGDIFRGRSTESIPFDPNNMDKYYREIYSKTSRIAITSGGLEEVEDAGKDGHSIFTYYLLKSLRENNNKYFDASQLFNDFRIAVTNNSEQTPLLQVVRDTGDEGGQFIFVKNEIIH